MKILSAITVMAVVMTSCFKEQLNETACDPDEVEVVVSLPEGEKANIADSGFSWSEGDVINWISSDGTTVVPCTLTASSIIDGNKAVFTASIPGVSSADVKGYFGYNISGKTVNFVPALYSSRVNTIQTEAGKIDSDRLFLFSNIGYDVIPKGTAKVDLKMNFAGTVIDLRPFTTSYNDEKVQTITVTSSEYLTGNVVYDHLAGTAAAPSAKKTKKYCLRLTKAFDLKDAGTPAASSSFYVTIPAVTLPDFSIVVRTDVASYTFKSTTARTFEENTMCMMALNLDKAERYAFRKLNVSGDMVSTNAPMKYVAYDFTPQGTWGVDSEWNNRAIGSVSGAETERRNKWDKTSNICDGNPATCFHTNFDIYSIGWDWNIRDLVADNYIQLSLGYRIKEFNLVITNPDKGNYLIGSDRQYGSGVIIEGSSDGSSFTKVIGSPFDFTGAANGTTHVFADLSCNKEISCIRIRPNNGATNVGDFGCASGYFGIAEIEIWNTDPTQISEDVIVTGVSLDKPTLSLDKGASATLTPTVMPANATNKKVTWSSDNTNIATVENGVVTGVAPGHTTIKVRTSDGGYKAQCDVTVLAKWDGGYPVGVTVVNNDAQKYSYALIDFKANPKLRFNVLHSAGQQLSTYFRDFDVKRGTPVIMTNADFFFNWEGQILSCDLVMSGGNMLRYPAYDVGGGKYPTRAALGQNSDGSFEINWIRGGSNERGDGPASDALYAYPAPYTYSSAAASEQPSTGRWWWWPREAIGGGPVMVVDGKNVAKTNYNLESHSFSGGTSDTYYTAKTCYGFRADGVMVILVENNLNLKQAADRMIELGCVKAMNFDGGGSSEMIGPNGVVIRKQTDTKERTMPSAICISEL